MLSPAVIIMYLLTAQEQLCLTKPPVMGQTCQDTHEHQSTSQKLDKTGCALAGERQRQGSRDLSALPSRNRGLPVSDKVCLKTIK